MIDTKALRQLAQSATPGPWVSKGRYIGTPCHMSYIGEVRDQCGNWSDTEKSRADAAFIAAANPAVITELLDRLEAAESECLEQARLNGMGSEREAALLAKLEAAKKDRANFLVEMGRLCAQCDALRAKIKAAEKSDAESLAMYRRARDERDTLRAALRHEADCVEAAKAKIEAMERQEPVG